jgi:propionate CoA-transferase
MRRLEEHLNVNTSTGSSKVCTAEEAIKFISPGSTIAIVGSGGGVNEPELLLTALEEQFLKKGTPGGLTLYHPNGIGNGHGGGSDHFAHKGFLRFVYGSHWSWAPRLSQMACEGAFGIAVWPQGVLSQLLRESAAGRPGILTHIGLDTYLDPRISGKSPGRQLKPELMELAGNIWLFYPTPTIDVALIRATTADEFGNLNMEHEGVVLDVLSAAQAARHSGGKVIAQVKRFAQGGTLDPRLVRVPGNLIDAIVVDPDQRQSSTEVYNPGYSGELKVQIPQRSHTCIERVLIARRAALELWLGAVVNLGFGIADGVASIVAEEGVADQITFSIEQGTAGGIPAWGTDFGLMWNPLSIIDAPS